MPHLTLTEQPKATAKPWFSHVLHRARKRTHTQAYFLAPDLHRAQSLDEAVRG